MTGTGEKILRCAQNDNGGRLGMTKGGQNGRGGRRGRTGRSGRGTKKLSPAGERIFYQAFRISCSSFTEGRTKSGFLGAAASISLSVSPESTSTDTAPAFCATAISV